jgi:DNA-binding transcriptional LysR family regulator
MMGMRMCRNAHERNGHMEWDDLEIVLAVHRGGTLVRAAEALGVAHTTVGRRLARVEDRLGVRLFDRTPGGLVPTPSGEDVAMTAERVEEEVQAMRNRVLGRDAHLSGPLRVSTVDVILACFGDAIASFVAKYPDVDLTLSLSRETVSLIRREADVAVRASNEPPETLVGRRIGAMQFGVYAARSLIERVGEDAPLGAYPWIGWGGGPNVEWFQGWLAAHAPGARRVLYLDDRGVMMAPRGARGDRRPAPAVRARRRGSGAGPHRAPGAVVPGGAVGADPPRAAREPSGAGVHGARGREARRRTGATRRPSLLTIRH